MARTALQVADKFVRLAQKEGKAFTQMHLLKLVYIAHGWMLAMTGEPLIYEEIEAWRYGPVIPMLYQALKHHHANPISEAILVNEADFSPEEDSAIAFTFRTYGHFTAYQLSNITHAENTPWSQVFGRGNVIPNDLIRAHYLELYKKYSE